MGLLRAFVGFFTSLRLTVVLLLLLTLDLLLGWYSLSGNATFYQPMNQLGLWKWLHTYGQNNYTLSAWFFVLLPLLFCLVVNTLCCTINKLSRLAATFSRQRQSRVLWFRLFVHLMHLAMVLLLVGYFISYSSTTIHTGLIVGERGETRVPGTDITISLQEMVLTPYKGDRLPAFATRYLNAQALLRYTDTTGRSEERKIAINSPAFFRGWSFFMQRFNPRSSGGMSAARYVVVDARRDPGIIVTFIGMGGFMLGLCGYLLLRFRQLPYKEEREKK